MATNRVRAAAQMAQGIWGVVLDADDTILDNSAFQLWLSDSGRPYGPSDWARWVADESAPSIPGARDFLVETRAAGGHIIVVTNRPETQCPTTRDHFNKLALPFDLIWCKRNGDNGKAERFHNILASGVEIGNGVHVSQVVAWVGDNILDFPGLSQVSGVEKGALSQFGTNYFMIPNPMYGSWEDLPRR